MTAELVIADGARLPTSYLDREIIDARVSRLRADLDDPYMLDRLGKILEDYDRVTIVCAPDRRAEWARALQDVNILGEIVMPEIAELGPITTRYRERLSSEERRVGKDCVCTCRSRGSA